MITNFEKYKEIVVENKGAICVDAETGIPQEVGSLECDRCLFTDRECPLCWVNVIEWLCSEYKPNHKL